MEEDLFKKTMKKTGVTPIQRNRKIRAKDRPSKSHAQLARSRAEDTDEYSIHHGLSTDEPPEIDPFKPLEYIAYDTDRQVIGLLDELPFPSQLEIDLHGLTVDQAAYAMAKLFQQIRVRRLSHIRITHGVGKHSKNGRSLLKAFVNKWLKVNPDVIAFASARRSDGGTGVVNVITRALTDEKWQRT